MNKKVHEGVQSCAGFSGMKVCATCTYCVTEELWVALGVQVCSALVLHLFLHCPFCASFLVKCDPQSGGGKG